MMIVLYTAPTPTPPPPPSSSCAPALLELPSESFVLAPTPTPTPTPTEAEAEAEAAQGAERGAEPTRESLLILAEAVGLDDDLLADVLDATDQDLGAHSRPLLSVAHEIRHQAGRQAGRQVVW